MTTIDEHYAEIYDELQSEFNSVRNRVAPEDLERKKAAPGDSSLSADSRPHELVPVVRPRFVGPPVKNRKSRAEADEEKMRQWRMLQITVRSAVANESIGMATTHAFKVFDGVQNAITDRYLGVKRPEAMNDLMGNMARRCLTCAQAGILAVLESHPKRVAEEL